MRNTQPVTVHERTALEWVLDGAAVANAIGCLALAGLRYSELPDTIPTHFNAVGEADGWGSKAFVWLLPIMAVLIIPLIIFLCGKPQHFNYLRQPQPENIQSAYASARLVLRILNVFIGGLLFLLTFEITHPGAGLLGSWLFLIIVAIPLLLVFNLLFRKN